MSNAVSEAAQRVDHRIDEVQVYLGSSLYSSRDRRELLEELREVVKECAETSLAEGRTVINLQSAYALAYTLLENYPSFLPRPEIGTLSDGEITFEWYRSPQNTLFACLNAKGDLSYAGIFDGDEVKNTVQCVTPLPPALWAQIERVRTVA